MSRLPGRAAALLVGLLVECSEAKKHCWHFEEFSPTYYTCPSHEDCCSTGCCVRAFSMRRLWYFGFLLMMGVLVCCGVSCFICRCMYPPPLIQEPVYNLSYTIQPPNPAAGTQQSVPPYYTYPEGLGMNPVGNTMVMAFQVQPNTPQGGMTYLPPPSYYNTPRPHMNRWGSTSSDSAKEGREAGPAFPGPPLPQGQLLPGTVQGQTLL